MVTTTFEATAALRLELKLLGTRHTICDEVTDETTQALEPTVTNELLSNPFPLIVNTVPPFMLPEFGDMDLIAAIPVTAMFD